MHYSVQAHWQQPLLKIRHSFYYSDALRGWSSALVLYDEKHGRRENYRNYFFLLWQGHAVWILDKITINYIIVREIITCFESTLPYQRPGIKQELIRGGLQRKVLYGGSTPKSNSLHFSIPFLLERNLFPIPSIDKSVWMRLSVYCYLPMIFGVCC